MRRSKDKVTSGEDLFVGIDLHKNRWHVYSMQESCAYKNFCTHCSLGTGCLVFGWTRLHLRIHRP